MSDVCVSTAAPSSSDTTLSNDTYWSVSLVLRSWGDMRFHNHFLMKIYAKTTSKNIIHTLQIFIFVYCDSPVIILIAKNASMCHLERTAQTKVLKLYLWLSWMDLHKFGLGIRVFSKFLRQKLPEILSYKSH